MLRLPVTIVRPILASRPKVLVLGATEHIKIEADSQKKVVPQIVPQIFPGINRVGSQICPPNIDLDYSRDLEAGWLAFEERVDSPALTDNGDIRRASRAARRTYPGSDDCFVY